MGYTPQLEAEETGFKTTTLLASGTTYNSSTVDWDGNVNGYSQVQTEVLASHDGTIDIDFCEDAAFTDVVRTISIPYTAANGYQFFAAPAFGNFIRYKFTNNGGVTQTDFYYTTKILTTAISPQLLTTEAFIAPSMVTELGRSIEVGRDPNGTFTNAPQGGIHNGNSTTTPLSGTGVFNGAFTNTDGYVSTSIFIKSDQDSATKGVKIVHSSDGVTDDRVIGLTYIAADNPQGILYMIPASTQYFRLQYVNGVSAQTEFITSIKFETSPQMLPTLPVNIPISNNTLANTVKAVSVGQKPDGTYDNSPHDGLGFSTFTPLTSGSTYSSGILDMSSYTQVQTDITSDGSGTIDIEFIRDEAGTDVVRELSIPYVGGSGFKLFSAPAFTPYVRYNFTSTTTGMTDFYFDTKFTTKSISGQILGMTDFISTGMVANLGRNVLVGQDENNLFNNVSVVPTTNASGTQYNLQTVSGARPSQLAGRVNVTISADTAVDELLHTVTSGKTLYITDIVLTIANSDTGSQGRADIRDSLTAGAGVFKVPLITAEAPNSSSTTSVYTHTFAEPMRFTVGVFCDIITGTNVVGGFFEGYEE